MATFDEWWALYPRKVGKGAARKAWDKATRKAEPGVLMDALYACLGPWGTFETRFIPHPSTWLNEERWDDDPPEPVVERQSRAEQARATTQWFEDRARQQRALGQ